MEPASSSMITEVEGDLFDAPDGAVLIRTYMRFHLDCFVADVSLLPTKDACNCKGSWGAGIAEAFRDKVSYPLLSILI